MFLTESGVNNSMRSRVTYIPKYSSRKDYSRKIRETEKKIEKFKYEGNWDKVAYLTRQLHNAWWGYKKYKK